MRINWLILLALLTLSVLTHVSPALAQTITATNPSDVSWAALSPGNDWSAQVLQSLFPIPGGTYTTVSIGATGHESTVIQTLVGQFTGFIAAIACAFVCYTTLMSIHRAAETSRILGNGQSWMFVARVGFAGIMMFPIGGGFSAGQSLVMNSAMVGIGMAKAVYANAIQAVGPDAATIAQPMIPGTETIVEGLISSELCMALINIASNNGSGSPLVPTPQPITVNDPVSTSNPTGGGYITYRYSLSTGNESGNPVCGTVTVREPQTNMTTVAGVSVDMAAVQQATLNSILTGYIRSQVQTVAQNLYTTKTAAALVPLQGILTSANSAYTALLTTQATSIQSAINAALQSQAANARAGNMDLLTSELQQSTLGWTAAGAYYLEIAKLNASTLSLLNATPVTTAPTYDGLGPAISADLAPMVTAAQEFLTTLSTVVQTTDGTNTPSGIPTTLADSKDAATNSTLLTRLFSGLNLSNAVLHTITSFLLPSTQVWTDPFGGLMSLGQFLINTSLIALGAAALLSSATTSTGAAIWNFLTGNWGAAAATVAGHAIMSFMGVPIFSGLMLIMIPGITIAYVLPMIPWVMWMAGVCGWIILVCEAMVAVPLWMLAHMTIGGDGLHGRAIEGWGLLFNVVFRPTLMVIGLFLGYFVFDCMSWLIRQSFGIAAGFVLTNGWIVTNFIGIAVLLGIFVMTNVVAALMSFRMVALLPHHLPRLIGFSAANRVDMEGFYQQAAMGPGSGIARDAFAGVRAGATQIAGGLRQLPGGPAGYIPGRSFGANNAAGAMDTTLRATTSPSAGGEAPKTEEGENV